LINVNWDNYKLADQLFTNHKVITQYIVVSHTYKFALI